MRQRAQTTVTLSMTGLMAAVAIALLGVVIIVVGVIYNNSSAFTFGVSLTSLGAGGALGVTVPTMVNTSS